MRVTLVGMAEPYWQEPGATLAAFNAAVSAAGDKLGAVDGAAVEAARILAEKIDQMRDLEPHVTEDGELQDEKRGRSLDNVTLPTFLKYLDALGLTPAGRRLLEQNPGGRPSGKLHAIREGVRSSAAS